MKVLHILGELNPSGAEVMLASAGPLLGNYGIDADILSTGLQPGRYAEQLAHAGFTLHHIPFSKNPIFFVKIYRLLKTNSYDVIHLHTERANFWLGLLALLSAKRCVRTIHSNFEFKGLLGWKRGVQRRLLAKFGLVHVGISQSVVDTEQKYFRLSTQLIPNWYNSLRFKYVSDPQRQLARQNLSITEDVFVLVSIGNCSEVKNHTALIRALADINHQKLCYLHIGIERDNSEQVLTEELGLTNKIRFLGLQADILPYLSAADLYVMPSLYEGFGIAALEALATGLPALLTKVTGLADLQQHFNGLFYCEPNAVSLTHQLTSIINMPSTALRSITGNNAVMAEQLFGIERGLSAYVALYKAE